MVIYRASYESRHFTFEAFDSTPALAHAALVRALYRHATTYGDVAQDWFAQVSEEALDEPCEPFTLGQGYRDGSPCDEGVG